MMAINNSTSAGKAGSTPRPVSPARLQQHSGAANAFGGYAKVQRSDGTFTMRKTEK